MPIGFDVRPSLPEAAIIEALGHPGLELLRIIPVEENDRKGQGLTVEAIPLDVFRPLTRAGLRLALVGISSS